MNAIAEAPDGSIRVLIVDDARAVGTWCWSAIERKLARGAVQQRVLVQIFGLGDFDRLKFDVKRIGVLKVLDFHGVNEFIKADG